MANHIHAYTYSPPPPFPVDHPWETYYILINEHLWKLIPKFQNVISVMLYMITD